ncbi:MAG: tyrosine-type recombinase/integrase [Stellaceae bacterium]
MLTRKKDAEYRDRTYLRPEEIDKLVRTAKERGRYGLRDALAITMAFRHGLRASELVSLRWRQIDFTSKPVHLAVQRLKGSVNSTQPVKGDELRMLREWRREQAEGWEDLILTTERGTGWTVGGFRRMLQRAAEACELGVAVHPHMLRHSAGFALADRGRDLREVQAFLGHKNVSNTTRYVELRPGRLDRIWD